MNGVAAFALNAVLIGFGATALTDLFVIFRDRVMGVPALDPGLIGRWIGHIAKGRFSHRSISDAPPITGERAIGWGAHYLIGIIFAAALLAIWGPEWTERPTVVPALALGLATVAAPFLLMQPAMGFGVAASRTPNPNPARLRTLSVHLVFGLGLYLSALGLTLWR